jgi:hypothetical protein
MYACGALTALRSPDKVDLLDCLETRVCSGAALPDGWNETLFADAIDVRPRAYCCRLSALVTATFLPCMRRRLGGSTWVGLSPIRLHLRDDLDTSFVLACSKMHRLSTDRSNSDTCDSDRSVREDRGNGSHGEGTSRRSNDHCVRSK